VFVLRELLEMPLLWGRISSFGVVACWSSIWGMPASGNPVPSDGDREQVVEIQGDNCRTPTGSAPYDLRAVLAPVEMPGPLLMAGIE
jgi:hypothetical protein